MANEGANQAATELELRSAELTVRVAPERGADVTAVTDARTGAQLLYRTPWADSRQPGPWAPDSRQAFHSLYPGGWQLLCPNAGDPAAAPGGTWGFHGEACLLRWTVEESGAAAATLSVRLSVAPLRVRRSVEVDGPVLRVRDTFANESPEPVSVAVVQHPAFGAPLVTPGARVAAGARRLEVDGGPARAWPAPDLVTLPEGGPDRAALGYLTDFTSHWAAITSAGGDLGVALGWSGDVLPHAWLWFEGNATADMPWYRSEYVLAVEPASTIPAAGVEHARRHGGDLVHLAPHATVTTTVCLAVHHDPRPVTGVTTDGRISFGEH